MAYKSQKGWANNQVINGIKSVGIIAKQKVMVTISFWLIQDGAHDEQVIPTTNKEITIANVIKRSRKNAIKRAFVNQNAFAFSFAKFLWKFFNGLIMILWLLKRSLVWSK